MRDLFRSLGDARVDFLVIGGQAAVLYGAAQFTQDLDLWIRPTTANLRALARALHAARARVHKLTPPLTIEHLRRGHGFHFVVPQAGALPAFLDVMGNPPRVGTYAAARARAASFSTPWGRLPVVAIQDLVELKKTNRLGDYDVISRLARLRLASIRSPRPRDVRWALANVFRAEDVHAIAQSNAQRLPRRAADFDPAVRPIVQACGAGREPTARDMEGLAKALGSKMLRLLEAGRLYWVPVLRELRTLRSRGELLPEGMDVPEDL